MKFTRLNITAEGQTEERFVKDVLSTYLGPFEIATDVRSVLTSKNKRKSHRGGLINYSKAKKDIETWLKEDRNPEARFTTMFDLYALPNDFPKYEEAEKINDPYQKVEFLEEAMEEDVDDNRFLAYIQLHEFESLVLAKPLSLEIEYFDRKDEIEELNGLLNGYKYKGNAELINGNNAPSKRIIKLIPEYHKVNAGPATVKETGMDFLKENCSHFNSWIEKLEKLSSY